MLIIYINYMDSDTLGETTAKLLIDDPSDFKFHAAYMAYAKAWDDAPDEEIKHELNDFMLLLAKNDDYSTFYIKIRQYGAKEETDYSGRTRFKTVRKRAWRQNESKRNRISRHKKR